MKLFLQTEDRAEATVREGTELGVYLLSAKGEKVLSLF